MACMAKLGWRLRQENNSLWVQTLSSKYNNLSQGNHEKVLNAWKGIVAANPIVENEMNKVVRNGHNTRFWMDRWMGERPMYDTLQGPVSLPELYASVADYWEEGRGWKWELLSNLIPAQATHKLAGFILSEDSGVEDSIG